MFESGSIIYGLFQLKNETKNKYAIVLHNDNGNFIITTFTTSKPRSSVASPSHGANPKGKENGYFKSYVFKANVPIGTKSDGTEFSFSFDTTVVPDYGVTSSPIENFQKKVSNLVKICDLYKEEYKNLIYTLYWCEDLDENIKLILEKVLFKIENTPST